jgi:CRISPR/Cas system-associated protein Csm6
MQKSFWLAVSALLAAVYAIYIVWSKFAKIVGAPPIKLSETGEFWLFCSAIAAFTLHIIVVEKRSGPVE